jgi:hypothetical protein
MHGGHWGQATSNPPPSEIFLLASPVFPAIFNHLPAIEMNVPTQNLVLPTSDFQSLGQFRPFRSISTLGSRDPFAGIFVSLVLVILDHFPVFLVTGGLDKPV